MRGVSAFLCGLLVVFLGMAAANDVPVARVEPVVLRTATGDVTLLAEIADSYELRARGLMFRHRLPEGRAMLFDFKQTRPVMMWMKNTHIPLDMVFIRANGTIARIAENTTPMSEDIIESGEPVAFVLEVPAGTARRIGLAPGDRVLHRLIPDTPG